MWIIAGLGNPGNKYDQTRHNAGFLVIDEIAKRVRVRYKKDIDSETAEGFMDHEKVMLIKPLTFMNLSGSAISRVVRYHKLGIDRLIVIHDDLDLMPGKLKIKLGGGAGGHKGIISVIDHIGQDFIRIKVGIGKPERGSKEGYVLGRFAPEERGLISTAVVRAADAVQEIIRNGCPRAMTMFNAEPEHS